MRVFVLLFNARTENEGIHTISIGDRNVVLMFAEEDDATRYALLLEAQDFPEPAVEALDQDEVEDFCSGAGYECKLIPQGFVPQDEFDRILLSPPEANLENTDWKPEGSIEVEDAEAPDPEIERMRRKLEGLL
ncbi:MAG: DUF3110 domain-containing protein [Candidatus Parcubacteria bacterium]|uniref:DUF3110 domain-containing protein n=1 Tax=Phormidesmis priestleyi TaxID=268141 RepID=UPI00083A5991|nr:DUF3110 domain-containing protein [Phormidesmis priestleyi]MBC7825946.1 DUF3110 domain-containing protein [Leptolyngbyaceae cyanobacterium LF-bin-113]